MAHTYMKIVQLITALGMVFLGFPFFKMGALPQGKETIIFELNGFFFSYITASAAFNPTASGIIIAGSMFIMLLSLAHTVQFLCAIIERPKVILYTAIILFATAFIFFLFTLKNDDISIIRWGYYAFMAAQVLLIILAPMAKPKPKKQNNINITINYN